MACEETFGPVAGIARFTSEDEAIRRRERHAVRARRVLLQPRPRPRLARLGGARVRHRRHQHRRHLDRGRAVRRRQGVGDRPRGLEVRDRRVARDQVPVAWEGSTRDRRAARLPRLHRQAERGRLDVRERGHRAAAASTSATSSGCSRPTSARSRPTPRCGRTTATPSASSAARSLQADPRLAGLPRPPAAAAAHPAEPHPDPDLVLADPLMQGKVAIVTGGAQGIGRAIAEGLAAAGARIVVADLHGRRGGGRRVPGRRRHHRRRRRRGVRRSGSSARPSSVAGRSTSSSTTPASTRRSRCARSSRSRSTSGAR